MGCNKKKTLIAAHIIIWLYSGDGDSELLQLQTAVIYIGTYSGRYRLYIRCTHKIENIIL